MKIVNMKITDITPYERNPRFNKGAVEAVADSIKEFGWRAPIVVDSNHVIICGHTRLLAAQKLGLSEVPVHIATDLTPEQARAYRIADNKTGEIAEWNFELLPLEIKELQAANFDLSLLGFNEDELAVIFGQPDDKVVLDGETDPDAVPDTPEEPVTSSGELYRLGDHLLLCGDATSAESVARLMGDENAALWLTDPPYNVALGINMTEEQAKRAHRRTDGKVIENDSMPDETFRDFLKKSFANAKNHLRPGGSFYIFHADLEGYNFRGALRDVDLKLRQCLIWNKNAMVLGRSPFQWKHEPCLFGWQDGAAHAWYNDRCQTTVLDFKKPGRSEEHPTMKPVDMLIYLIQCSSTKGEVVLDTFGGAGSTLIACEQTGRKCRMMELDPRYCDVIRKRWAEFMFGEGCDWIKKTPVVR